MLRPISHPAPVSNSRRAHPRRSGKVARTVARPMDASGDEAATQASVAWEVRAERPAGFRVEEVRGLFDPSNDALRDRLRPAGDGDLRLVIADETFLSLHGAQVRAYLDTVPGRVVVRTIPGGEGAKTAAQADALLDLFDASGLGRWDAPVAAMGGGACLDVVGFAASIYRRGVPYLRIPTTLMAQIDAGIGAKTAINWGQAKNRVGAFAPPAHVLIDYDLLKTLPPRHLANGIAEIIKMAVCSAPGLFGALERHMEGLARPGWDNAQAVRIYRWAVQAMLAQLSPNLFETDPERLVDFGHWLSPHLELQDSDVLHGEAVAVDMAVSCALAARRGLLSAVDLERVLALIERACLPISADGCTPERIARALQETRRHRGGRQRIPLPTRPGRCLFADDLTVEEALAACRSLEARAAGCPAPAAVG